MDDQLPHLITEFKDEIRVLRDAVDELRKELSWLCNNMPLGQRPRPFRLRSLSVDPASPDFQLNNVCEEQVELRHDLTSRPGPHKQRDLF